MFTQPMITFIYSMANRRKISPNHKLWIPKPPCINDNHQQRVLVVCISNSPSLGITKLKVLLVTLSLLFTQAPPCPKVPNTCLHIYFDNNNGVF